MAGIASSAQAATYTVGTTSDTPSGEKCPEPASDKCSLRQLIEYENGLTTPPSPPDIIVVPAGNYELSDGTLTITQSLVIVGAGARTTTVYMSSDTDSPGRVFDIESPAESATGIFGLKIADGTADADESYGGFGGDIRNTTGDLLLSEDWITEGTASDGGGISNDGGTLVIERSLVSGNHATSDAGDSGGIQNYGTAKYDGVFSPDKKAILAIEDSTVADNEAAEGGGIFSWSEDGVEDENGVSIINSTIAYNKTTEACPEDCEASKGAGLLATDGTIDVVGSIVALNNGTVDGEYTLSNCSFENATIDSLGYNLENGTECGFKSTGDLQNTQPDFSSSTLQNNGGSTDTFAPEPTSPAVDAIPTSAPFCDGTDQRGIARPQDGGCDIGAVELVPFTIEATEGSQFSGPVTANLTEGIYTTPAPTIEWGDGTASAGTVDEANSTVSGTHTYARAGTYDGSVTYHNDGGSGTHKIAFQAKVADAALSATGVPVSATAGAQFTGTVATFTDADPESVASDFTATIDWGDGTATTGTIGSAAGGGFTVTGSHTYANGGAYATSIAIKDVGGATATATSTATVAAVATTPAPPTVVAAAPPSVLSTTSAAFTATVNPEGLATEVHFEYGPVLPGAKAAAITYGSVTPNQSVGSDFANHTVTATVTGLLPNVTYNVRAVATNSAGTALSSDQVLVTPADPPPPPPVLGKAVNVTPVSGIVYIELPPGAALASAASVSPFSSFAIGAQAVEALTKGQSFIPLTEARQIPVGSVLEATGGVVGITTATTASQKGKLQSGDFGAGIFKLLQGRRQKGLTDLDIIDNHNPRQVCTTLGKGGARAAKHLSSKTLGRVNASAHGHFTVRGQYSAATVRGTVWNVSNRCEGTLTHVTRGVVAVRDFRRRKTITLFTGESYLARAPHR